MSIAVVRQPSIWTPCASPNGNTYTAELVTAASGYDQRDGAKLHFFNGKYWLLGGWYPTGSWHAIEDVITTNEIWSSVDLVTWTQEAEHDPDPPTSGAGARWRRRHAFGSCVHDGYLWVIGGDGGDAAHFGGWPSDVWRSPDGTTWERVAETSPIQGLDLPIVGEFRGWIHVMGGSPGGNDAVSRHWRTRDGVTWQRLADMPFARGGVVQPVELCGKLFIIGGYSGNVNATYTLHDSTWAFDGRTWNEMSASADWTARHWVATAAYDDKLWLLTGRDPANVEDAWHSEDLGVTWDLWSSTAPWAPSHADGITVTEQDGIVIASGNGQGSNVYRLTVDP